MGALTYKEELTNAMTTLGQDPLVRFVGYGVTKGKAMGTLKGVPESQLIETPVAENLMVGLAAGMSLAGLRPVVFIERMDFLLNAADAIVNHLDKMVHMSNGEFKPAVIIRVVVGNKKKPLYTGETHTQDFTEAFCKMLRMTVFAVPRDTSVTKAYNYARVGFEYGYSTMIVEYKDLL
jgi:pyruvate/2-oxoglutarate/acetoin dehydrogenase E1 component